MIKGQSSPRAGRIGQNLADVPDLVPLATNKSSRPQFSTSALNNFSSHVLKHLFFMLRGL